MFADTYLQTQFRSDLILRRASRRTVPMLRVAVAASGDLLRDSIHSCLSGSVRAAPKTVSNVRELLVAVETKQVDAVILDDQFDTTAWLGNLVVALRQIGGNDLIIVVVGTFLDGM